MDVNIINLLNRLKICYKHKILYCYVLKNKSIKKILFSLKEQGFILGYRLEDNRKNYKIYLDVFCAMATNFSRLRIISSPSKKFFLNYFLIKKKYKPYDFFIIKNKNNFYISSEVFILKKSGMLICDTFSFK